MTIDELPDEARKELEAQLRKEWEAEKRFEAYENIQAEHGKAIKTLNEKVDPLVGKVDEIHTAVVGLQGGSSKWWAKFDKGIARVAAIVGLATILGAGLWGLFSWISNRPPVASATVQVIKP